MKIGDKVRFLSTTGGGVIVGFQDNKIVLVEDNDGFQIPTMANDLVVVNEDKQARSVPGFIPEEKIETKETANEKEETGRVVFNETSNRVSVEEYDGNDIINVNFGFVPQDKKNLSKTKYSLYIINDCNYFLSYTYSLYDGKSWKLQSHNDVEPNTKLLIAEVEIEKISDFQFGALQILSYKLGKTYDLKPTQDVKIKIDPVKFYKLHTFKENDFFDEDAFIIPLIRDGKPLKELKIDKDDLKEKMLEKQKTEITSPARKVLNAKRRDNEPLVIDLHASELLETTAGMSHTDILNYQLDTFRNTLEEFKKKKGMKIIFIHGKGEGVLRNAIIHELRYRYKTFTYQDASFQEYGYGATQITIR